MQRKKNWYPNDIEYLLRKITISLFVLLLCMQLIMLNDDVREKLSFVEQIEGQTVWQKN